MVSAIEGANSLSSPRSRAAKRNELYAHTYARCLSFRFFNIPTASVSRTKVWGESVKGDTLPTVCAGSQNAVASWRCIYAALRIKHVRDCYF